MTELNHLLVAWFAGALTGFIASFVPGPVNVAIINQGARRGFQWGFMIGLGSTAMEVIYCAIAFAGVSTFVGVKAVKAVMELVSFLMMIFLGIKYLRAKAVEEHNTRADRFEQRLHPHSAFLVGFVQVLGNLGVLLMWVVCVAAFSAHDWVNSTWLDRLVCISGVAAGALVWFVLLAYAVGRRGRQFSPQTLLRMEHFSGALLLIVATVIGVRIIIILGQGL